MVVGKHVRRNSGGGKKRNRKSSSNPKPKNESSATYSTTYRILSYLVHVFRDERVNGTVGQWYNDGKEIYLHGVIDDPVAATDVLLHEIIHAISDIGLSPEDRLSERQVNLLSSVLVDSLHRNPELLEVVYRGLIG